MEKKQINILLIHTDQHRSDCIGVGGNKEIQTPNIDRLAKDGVMYTNSFCSAPFCAPSRYSMLTGVYPHEHGAMSNKSTLPQNIQTFPQLLREEGYSTKGVGKMHFTPQYLDAGFDELELDEKQRAIPDGNDYLSYLKSRNHTAKTIYSARDKLIKTAEYALPEEYHNTTWTGHRALAALEMWQDGKHFLMVGFNRPHPPFDPPEPWRSMYSPDDLSLLPGWLDNHFPEDMAYGQNDFLYDINEGDVKKVMSYYYALISQIDLYVGRMIELLKKKGLYENTMIIFTSDHGEYMGFHRMLGKSNYMYDPIVKVPLIIKYPGGMNRGCVMDGLINNIDLAPTILKQAGVKPVSTMKGLNLEEGIARNEVLCERGGRKRVHAAHPIT